MTKWWSLLSVCPAAFVLLRRRAFVGHGEPDEPEAPGRPRAEPAPA